MDVKTAFEPSRRRLTAYLSGDIDHHTAAQIRADVDSAIRSTLPASLVLDFKNVSFMDSSGIGLVMGRYKEMSALGGSVFIQDPPPYIRRVMQLAGLNRLCRIISSPPPSENDENTDMHTENNTEDNTENNTEDHTENNTEDNTNKNRENENREECHNGRG